MATQNLLAASSLNLVISSSGDEAALYGWTPTIVYKLRSLLAHSSTLHALFLALVEISTICVTPAPTALLTTLAESSQSGCEKRLTPAP
jgi:hypothetical protein